MRVIEHQTLDMERALYDERDLIVRDCVFDGPADGESALKESRNIRVERCLFNLRYPFWHDTRLTVIDSELTPLCRAALWYSRDIDIKNTKLHGIKALRECERVNITNCDIVSPEFGWSSHDIDMRDCTAQGEYFMLRASKLRISGLRLDGKYSFQYISDAVFENCELSTKDSFWHAKNVVVKNSVINGEYLAWYAEGLTLDHCRIVGTQPLCYCKGLKLIDCEMVHADLSFEKSEVEATLTAPILSVKNPLAGVIKAPSVGETIMDDPNARGVVVTG